MPYASIERETLPTSTKVVPWSDHNHVFPAIMDFENMGSQFIIIWQHIAVVFHHFEFEVCGPHLLVLWHPSRASPCQRLHEVARWTGKATALVGRF